MNSHTQNKTNHTKQWVDRKTTGSMQNKNVGHHKAQFSERPTTKRNNPGKDSGQNSTFIPSKYSIAKKRQMREEKYKSGHGNKAEGHGFAERKKEKMVHQYRRLLTKDRRREAATGVKSAASTSYIPGAEEHAQEKKKKVFKDKVNPYHHAVQQAQVTQSEKEQQWKDVQQKKTEQELALKQYKQRRNQKHKVLAKKTFRGQPSMASRMDLLLQQIQETHT